MSIQDPIADMLTRIRNAQAVKRRVVRIPASKQKEALLAVLSAEGFVDAIQPVVNEEGRPELEVALKYHGGAPVIAELRRISRPGLRVYKSKAELPKVKGGLGVAVISTSRGVMPDREARRQGLGGEVLCFVS
ncbi:MAG: 30S ribosomal protein S8 [Gammaproteobacteria bacterium RIFCSPHIGHO2_12_FULL_45_9]|nr:MAG: 30S ribosomal protein S8 [Gammaproteobacteria bacterium RIFCSPHIGHO2_12_FULL_45_9]